MPGYAADRLGDLILGQLGWNFQEGCLKVVALGPQVVAMVSC